MQHATDRTESRQAEDPYRLPTVHPPIADPLAEVLRCGARQMLNAPRSVTTGDFNGDGLTDLATANDFSEDLSVLLGNCDGTFQTQRRFAVGDGPVSVTTGDFNGDGLTDLVTANRFSDDVSVLLGNGDGTFQTQRRFDVGIPWRACHWWRKVLSSKHQQRRLCATGRRQQRPTEWLTLRKVARARL